MSSSVFFSICIPAYKHPKNIERLLSSIRIQTFEDFEIVISDDSPDESVREVLNNFSDLPIRYFRNMPSLGMPQNWNFAIEKAQGEWIKIMHDDDWFSTKESLSLFAEETKKGRLFIFSSYTNIYQNGKRSEQSLPQAWKKRIIKYPLTLMARNVIGPPSITLIHKSVKLQYDERMKWRVDIDFYIRILLQEKTYSVIRKPIVYVGISKEQVTHSCYNIPEVELPEAFLLLTKYGLSPLRHILVYDAWWRMLRNMNIRDEKQLVYFVGDSLWPVPIIKMLWHESIIPSKILRIGLFSKLSMCLSFLINRKLLID